MWAYDDGRGRRTKDIPSSHARRGNYYDDTYQRAPPRSSRDEPKHRLPHDRHHRKPALVHPDEQRSTRRRSTHAGVNVVASDDGLGSAHGGRSSRGNAYGSSYPDKKSRHDVEYKTSDRDRSFREKRGTWESDEAENLKRAKSYSPRRAAREAEAPRRVSPQAPKSAWSEDQYGASHRSSNRSNTGSGKGQLYSEDDPYAGYYAGHAPRGKRHDRGSSNAGYEYPPSPADMPRPPLGDHSPYKSSPLTAHAGASDEKPSKHHRRREKDYYGTGYEDYPAAKAGGGYDPGAAAEDDPPPRRSRARHGKHHDERAGADDYDYDYDHNSYPPQAQNRGRHRGPPPSAGAPEGVVDPYPVHAPPARPRHRQSLPPQGRSQYPEDPYQDQYGQAAPRRRATSVNHGHQDRHGGEPRRDQYYYDDDAYGSGGGGGAKKNNKKSKAYAQQAGKLFMTHAVPVIKKEAVPFLTKAAQAYFEQQKR